MATTNYILSINDTDKQRAEQVFNELGMTFSTGINIYIQTVSRQQKIPFELSLSSPLSAANIDISDEERRKAFNALDGLLAGHEVDLDKEREERILSK